MKMTDNELIYVSVILQLLHEGKANTIHASPSLRNLLEEITAETRLAEFVDEYEDL